MKFSIFKTLIHSLILSLTLIAQLNVIYAQNASILPPAKTQFLDQNGKPLTKGTVQFYLPGTTTQATTYQDSAATIPNTNPIVLDAGGRALILGNGVFRQVVKDVNNNLIWDQVTSSPGVGSTGSIGSGDGNNIGTILPWIGFVAPTGYVFAAGQALNRITFASFFALATLTQSVTCTGGSPILTAVVDTSQISINSTVEAPCIPAGSGVTNRTTNSVTLNNNANISTTTSATFFPFGNGDGSTTFNVPDLRGKTLIGRNNMGGNASSVLNTLNCLAGIDPNSLGANCGQQANTITIAQLPSGLTPSGTIINGAITAGAITNGAITNGAITINSSTGSPIASTGAANVGGGGSFSFAPTTLTASQAATTQGATTQANPTQAFSTFVGNTLGGSSTPSSLIPPSLSVNYIIKTTGGVFNGLSSLTAGLPLVVTTANSSANVVLNLDPVYFGLNGSNQLTMSPALGAMAYQNSNSVAISGGTASGLAISNSSVTGLPPPVNPNDAATKLYADNIAGGIRVIVPSRLATIAALPANTYNNGAAGVGATLTEIGNGALIIDSIAANTNDIVLILNEVTQANNGLYTVTNAGSAGTQYVLTRIASFNQSSNMLVGATTTVTAGTINLNRLFTLAGTVSTVGTTAVIFNPYGVVAGSVNAGAGGIVPTGGNPAILVGEQPTFGGRISLQSGTCVSVTDQVAKTSVFFSPCGGGRLVPIYDGTNMKLWPYTSSFTDQIGQTLALGSAWTANTNFDVIDTLVGGVPTLCTVAWSNSGVGTSARATAILFGIGINVNATAVSSNCRINNTTLISVAQYQGTLVGGFRTNAAGQVDLKFGTIASGGGTACICIYSVYNPQEAFVSVGESTTTWVCTPIGIYAQANTCSAGPGAGNQINVFQGVPTNPIDIHLKAISSNSVGNSQYVGIGLDSTSINSAISSIPNVSGTSFAMSSADLGANLAIGYHILTRLEGTVTGGTTTSIGFSGTSFAQSSIFGKVWY